MKSSLKDALLAGHGVISSSADRHLKSAVSRRVQSGSLVRMLPGVVARRELATDWVIRLRAVSLWRPEGVFWGQTAVALHTGLVPSEPVVQVALTVKSGSPVPWCVAQRREIPSAWRSDVGGVSVTVPALTAVDLADRDGGATIDDFLRRRWVRYADLVEALGTLPHRRGQQLRRQVVFASRDEPWSPPERELHSLLRSAGIGGWRTNVATRAAGRLFYLDIAFTRHGVGLEVDGYSIHSARDVIERDRFRHNELSLAGWHLLRFTPRQIAHDPEWVLACVRGSLAWKSGTGRPLNARHAA